MTESEWLGSQDTEAMLRIFSRSGVEHPKIPGGKLRTISDRKLRLWVSACFRGASPGIIPRKNSAVEVAERFADGCSLSPEEAAAYGTWTHTDDGLRSAICLACSHRDTIVAAPNLLRDIVGNPWRRPIPAVATKHGDGWVSYDYDAVLNHNNGIVLHLAEQIYQDRDFRLMGQLADALMEAGCEDEEILQHCRGMVRCPSATMWEHGVLSLWPDCLHNPPCDGSGWLPSSAPHVRGCWVIDLLTGRE